MRRTNGWKCLIALAVALCFSSVASAQEATLVSVSSNKSPDLRFPSAVLAAAAASDWSATYYGLSRHRLVESNPLIKGLQDRPALMVTTGAAIDIGAVMIWNRYMGKRHPKIAKVALYAASAYRFYLLAHNARIINETAANLSR